MRLASTGAALGAALLLASCAWFAVEPEQRRTAALENDMFIAAALAHAQSELELAQLAQQKAHTPSLVAYARRIADERASLHDRLAAAAKADGAAGDGNHTPDIAAFRPLEGEAFERAYVGSQIEDQQNNLDFFDFEAKNGSNAELKDLAASTLPQLQQDLADALNIVKDLPFEQTTDASQGVVVSPRRR
jgi:predicted outer membrane protein